MYLAGATRDHRAPADLAAQKERSVDVEIHHLAPARVGMILHRGAPVGTGVVHQDVDLFPPGEDGIDERRYRGAIGQIAGLREHLDARCFEMRACRVQLVLLAGHQRNRSAHFAERLGHLQSDAARPAGHERDLAAEVEKFSHAHGILRRGRGHAGSL